MEAKNTSKKISATKRKEPTTVSLGGVQKISSAQLMKMKDSASKTQLQSAQEASFKPGPRAVDIDIDLTTPAPQDSLFENSDSSPNNS